MHDASRAQTLAALRGLAELRRSLRGQRSLSEARRGAHAVEVIGRQLSRRCAKWCSGAAAMGAVRAALRKPVWAGRAPERSASGAGGRGCMRSARLAEGATWRGEQGGVQHLSTHGSVRQRRITPRRSSPWRMGDGWADRRRALPRRCVALASHALAAAG